MRSRLAAAVVVVAWAACGGKPSTRPRHDAAGDAGRGAGPATGSGSAPGSGSATDSGPGSGAGSATGAGPGSVAVGSIAVTVVWPDAPAAVRASPGVTACATPRPPRATIGALHGVAGAIVIVDGVAPARRLAAPARLTARDCAIAPAAAVLPAGGTLEVQAQDDAGHVIAIEDLGAAWQAAPLAEPRSVTRARLPVWGHTVALPLPAAGARRVVLDDGEAAWVAVTDGASAVTAADGTATLADVPPGADAVIAWLPPAAGQPSVLARGEATVVAGDRVELTLRLRP
jgi:hypothetical protein